MSADLIRSATNSWRACSSRISSASRRRAAQGGRRPGGGLLRIHGQTHQSRDRALEADQALYYDGPHTGHVLTYEQGRQDARTWADYINVGMEHGTFDMTGLENYMRGLVEGGPTASGHRSPAIIVEPPVNGTDGQNVAFNAWQFRQLLARGVHGILLCQAESGRRRSRVRAGLPLPASQGWRRQDRYRQSRPRLGADGRRRSGALISNNISSLRAVAPPAKRRASAWCKDRESVRRRQLRGDPGSATDWGLPSWDRVISAFLSATRHCSAGPIPRRWKRPVPACSRACRKNKLAFLEGATPDKITASLDEGVRVISGHNPETAKVGRRIKSARCPSEMLV